MNPYLVQDFNRIAGETDDRQSNPVIVNNFLHLQEEVGEMASNLRKALADPYDRPAFEGVVDGAMDTVYMAIQVLLKMGLTPMQIDMAWTEVCEQNLAKGEDCEQCAGTGEYRGQGDYVQCGKCNGTGALMSRDASGKIIKPKDWRPPTYEWLTVKGWGDSPFKG